MSMRTRSVIFFCARLVALALVVLTGGAALQGCGGDKTNGSLCASCGQEDDAACGKMIVPDPDLHLFCGNAGKDECNICFRDDDDVDGDGSRGEFICQVQLVCVRPEESAARRCYPAKADGTAHESFTCGGVNPDV